MVRARTQEAPVTEISARPLSEQCVVIPGGTSGIGLATAKAFAEAGAAVRLIGRNPGRGWAAAEVLGENAGFVQADCSDAVAVETAFAGAAEEMGGLDTMVCTLGGTRLPDLLFKLSMEDIRTSLTQDLAPVLYCGRAAVTHLMSRGGGTIVNVASDAGKIATPGEVVIGAGMAAIIQFTRGIAIEGKRNGIRANALTPSLVEGTPLTDRLMEEGRFSAKLFAKARPLANLGPTYPEDLAAMALFLASPAAAKITGQAVSINGGISAA